MAFEPPARPAGIEFEPDALAHGGDLTGRYPYSVQEFDSAAWEVAREPVAVITEARGR